MIVSSVLMLTCCVCFHPPHPNEMPVPPRCVSFLQFGQVADDVKRQIMSIADVLNSQGFGGRTQEVSDLLRSIERSDLAIFKVFSSMPIGKQMLRHAQHCIDACKHRESLLERLAQFGSGNGVLGEDGTCAGLVVMDDAIKEHASTFGSCVSPERDAAVQKMLTCVASVVSNFGADVGVVLAKILDGNLDGMTFEGGKLVAFQQQLSDMAVISDFEFWSTFSQPPAELSAISAIRAVLDCPLELLASTPEEQASIKGISLAEDLIHSMAKVSKFDDTTFTLAGLDTGAMRRMIDAGRSRTSTLKQELMDPKIKSIIEVVYFDDAEAKYWHVDSTAPVPEMSSFVLAADIEHLDTQYQKIKKNISSIDALVAQYQCLAVAFKELHLASVVRFQWHVARLRVSFSALQKDLGMHRDSSELPVDQLCSIFLQVVDHCKELRVTIEAASLQADFAEVEQLAEDERCGVVAVPFEPFIARARLGLQEGQALLAEVVGLWSLRLHSTTQALQAGVPEYQDFVVEVFDPVQVREKLLAKSWEGFVRDWACLNRVYTAIKARLLD